MSTGELEQAVAFLKATDAMNRVEIAALRTALAEIMAQTREEWTFERATQALAWANGQAQSPYIDGERPEHFFD